MNLREVNFNQREVNYDTKEKGLSHTMRFLQQSLLFSPIFNNMGENKNHMLNFDFIGLYYGIPHEGDYI